MLPIVTVAEMRAIDAAAPEPVDVLVERAGAAVARTAVAMLGGTYGRRVVVVAGRGNNGADGRVAARRLSRLGVHTTVFDIADVPPRLPAADLVIDAALGTGVSRPFHAPDPGEALVLAVDVPSGLDGDTGLAVGAPMPADVTVTFAAHKPGLLFADGPRLAGEVVVADVGLDVSRATIRLVTDAGTAAVLPDRRRDAHKWNQAVVVVAGSPGMTGAAVLAAAAASRAGAGMVRLATPGVDALPGLPAEVVRVPVDDAAWADALATNGARVHAAVVGPGLGTSMVTRHQIRSFVAAFDRPLVIDGDGLTAIGADAATLLRDRVSPAVLTPHDGEFERLAGHRPGFDRIGEARGLAEATGAVVLLKGPATVVAAPDGAVRVVTSGDERLATAGTGDVLAGIIGALLAAGIEEATAAAAGAHLHGLAGRTGPRPGTVAGDVVAGIPAALAHVRARAVGA